MFRSTPRFASAGGAWLAAIRILVLGVAVATPAYAQQPVTVSFWNIWDGPRAPQMRQVLDYFEGKHPNIKVQNVVLSPNTDTQRMITAIAGGKVPDIYMTHQYDFTRWADLDAFIPLDAYLKRDNIDLSKVLYVSAIEGSTYKGKVIQLPFRAPASLMIWYNKDMFRKAGLDPNNPPATWQELEKAAKALTVMKGDTIEQLGFNVCINCVAGPEHAYIEWLSRNNGQVLNGGGTDVAFDNKAGIDTLRWMVSFMQNTSGGWANMAKQMGHNWTDQRPLFYSGKLAMIMDGPWFYNVVRKDGPQMLDKVGVFLLPVNGQNPDAKQRFLSYGVAGYAIPKGAPNPDAAWEVLKFIALDRQGGCEFFLLQARNDTPLINCGAESKATNPYYDVLLKNLNSVQSAASPPTFPEVALRLKQMQESALLGKETPDEAIKSAAADVRRILKK